MFNASLVDVEWIGPKSTLPWHFFVYPACLVLQLALLYPVEVMRRVIGQAKVIPWMSREVMMVPIYGIGLGIVVDGVFTAGLFHHDVPVPVYRLASALQLFTENQQMMYTVSLLTLSVIYRQCQRIRDEGSFEMAVLNVMNMYFIPFTLTIVMIVNLVQGGHKVGLLEYARLIDWPYITGSVFQFIVLFGSLRLHLCISEDIKFWRKFKVLERWEIIILNAYKMEATLLQNIIMPSWVIMTVGNAGKWLIHARQTPSYLADPIFSLIRLATNVAFLLAMLTCGQIRTKFYAMLTCRPTGATECKVLSFSEIVTPEEVQIQMSNCGFSAPTVEPKASPTHPPDLVVTF
ncbi:unnamed protein product, partial [Mesorhabditis spiculigera]